MKEKKISDNEFDFSFNGIIGCKRSYVFVKNRRKDRISHSFKIIFVLLKYE